RRIKLCRNNAGIFHPRTPGILVITVIEKIITVITRLKKGYFNFPDSEITVSNKMLRNIFRKNSAYLSGAECSHLISIHLE
ncbi:hypothetical protein, partial [Mediterraneibacter gnavus]|uniref:hypothetical protein n=2 Tax=Mediterraneibacter gnavus TaxID=33038 RepID=UPI0031B616B7